MTPAILACLAVNTNDKNGQKIFPAIPGLMDPWTKPSSLVCQAW